MIQKPRAKLLDRFLSVVFCEYHYRHYNGYLNFSRRKHYHGYCIKRQDTKALEGKYLELFNFSILSLFHSKALVFFLCFFGCCRLILSVMPTFLGGLGRLRFCRGTMRQYKVLQHRLAGIWSLIFQYSYAVILVYYLYDQSLILVYSTLHPAYFSDLFWFLGFFY